MVFSFTITHMRALATIRVINKLVPIEGADAIMLAIIDGWQCVVKKDEFKEGDMCVYFEIDSIIPMIPEVEHLRERSFKRVPHLNVEGIRVKTIKLRGQLSQGLALPIMDHLREAIGNSGGVNDYHYPQVGMDVTDLLGVVKYEVLIPSELDGIATGSFPSDIPRTAQDRCQNILWKIFTENVESRYEVSMKLDGTSFTGIARNGVASVCGRRWELEMEDPENKDNHLVRLFIDSGLRDAILKLNRNIAIQGELMGPAHAMPNREKLKICKLFVFDMYDIDKGEYLTPVERHAVMDEIWESGVNPDLIQHAPIMHMDVTLAELGITNIAELLLHADGPSIIHAIREGLVFKRMDGKFSFKVISNKYLLKEE